MAEEHTVNSPHAQDASFFGTAGMGETRPESYVATVALVGLGVALLEVELIPGMLIGVAAMLFPKLVPRLGTVVRPVVKSVIRAGVAATARARETVAEATEQFQDIVAEARAQDEPSHGDHAGAERPQASSDPPATPTTPTTPPSGSEAGGPSSGPGTERKQDPKDAGRPEESTARSKRPQPH